MSIKKNPLVSVIITNYNLSNLIFSAIESVVDQNYKPLEIIIVDDGSNNNPSDFMENLKKYKNFKYFFLKKNYGLSYAKNYGLKKAKGDLICFLDADDTFPKNSIKLRVKELINNPEYKIVCGSTNYFNSENNFMYLKKVDKSKLNKKNSSIEYLNSSRTPFITATVMYRKEVFKEIGCYDTNIKILRSEDADFTYRLLEKYKILTVDNAVYNYFKGSKPRLLRIKHLFLQLRGKIYSISKNKSGFEKTYLIFTNILFFPRRFIHQVFFF